MAKAQTYTNTLAKGFQTSEAMGKLHLNAARDFNLGVNTTAAISGDRTRTKAEKADIYAKHRANQAKVYEKHIRAMRNYLDSEASRIENAIAAAKSGVDKMAAMQLIATLKAGGTPLNVITEMARADIDLARALAVVPESMSGLSAVNAEMLLVTSHLPEIDAALDQYNWDQKSLDSFERNTQIADRDISSQIDHQALSTRVDVDTLFKPDVVEKTAHDEMLNHEASEEKARLLAETLAKQADAAK